MIRPQDRLLHRYFEGGHYVDCFTRKVPRHVDIQEYIAAFYGSRLFAVERFILKCAKLGATRADISALAEGRTNSFAAWHVEARTDSQILLRDVKGATASWLAVLPTDQGTTLFFGSAVVLKAGRKPRWLRPMLWFHVAYAKRLLASARL